MNSFLGCSVICYVFQLMMIFAGLFADCYKTKKEFFLQFIPLYFLYKKASELE